MILLHILAIPLGLLILVAAIMVVGLLAEYPLETIGFSALVLFCWWVGANILGLVS